MKWSWVFITIALAGIGGCAGQLYTFKTPDKACENNDCDGKYPGVLIYPLVESVEVYIQDKILGPKGELTHWINGPAGQACTPTLLEERKLVPKIDEERLISYESAFFEISTFSVDLNANGTLAKVGTASTPGGKNLVDSLVSLSTTVKTLNHGQQKAAVSGLKPDDSLPLCSHGRVWVPNDVL